jgi:serine/threonine protein phosphatase PrpC
MPRLAFFLVVAPISSHMIHILFYPRFSCTPDIIVRERAEDEDMYLILACDGIWDVMSNEDVGDFVARRVDKRRNDANNGNRGEVLARVGDELLAACLIAGSRDNMSVLIVAFPGSGLASLPLSKTSMLEMAELKSERADKFAPVDVTVRALAYE